MKEKFISLVTSTRFIGLVLVGLMQALVLFNVVTSAQGEGLIHIIQSIVTGAVVIRTVDRNTGDAKIIASGVGLSKKKK